MDALSRVAGASTPPESTPSGGPQKASKDEFLKLLVAQMQNQDPLSPQDGAAFVAQLAQFASLEQSAETNNRLQEIASGQASSTRAGYSNLVGRAITVRTDRIEPPSNGTAASQASVHLDGPAANVEVIIRDAGGKEIKKLSLGPRAAGDSDYAWDGTDEAGVRVPDGQYRIEVKATAADGSAVGGSGQLRAKVDAVAFDGGAVRFKLGNIEVSPADIVDVRA